MDAALHLRSIGGQHMPLYHALRQFEDATVLDCDTTFHKVCTHACLACLLHR